MSADRIGLFGRVTTKLLWRGVGVMALVAVAVALLDHGGRWHTAGRAWPYVVKLWLYWGTWLVAPLVWVALVLELKQALKLKRWLAAALASCLVGLTTLGLWAGLVETHLLRVRETTMHRLPPGAQPVRIALVADVHWGLFFRDHQLRRLVERLNQLDVDAVVVAGDWTYEPRLDLEKGFAPFKSVRVPVFGVLGNHDVQAPGPALSSELRAALTHNGVRLLEGRRVPFKGWELVGLDDLGGGRPRAQIRRLWPDGAATANPPRLVVTHQPDTAAFMPPGAAFLIMSGHTHGGQIWLPKLTPALLRRSMRFPWWDGLYSLPAGQLMVTPGVGTIGLPARLGVSPTIDVIDIRP